LRGVGVCFLGSSARLLRVDPGFEARGVLVARLSLPAARYRSDLDLRRFYDSVAAELRATPGVESISAGSVLPLSGMNTRTDFTIVGRAVASATDVPGAQNRWVAPGYFRTLGIRLRSGREFSDHDGAAGQPVAIVDETLARRYWPEGNALGARIRMDLGVGQPAELEVVGVAGAVKHFNLDEEALGTLYAPLFQVAPSALSSVLNGVNLVVRTNGDPLALVAPVRRAVARIDPTVPAS